ncbi:hypothetical protein BH23ACT10_BH23ACT10_16410 [soil metagenome]
MSATTTTPGPATTASEVRPRAVYSRVAGFGLLLLAAAPLLMLIVGVVSGMSLADDGPFLAVVAVVSLLASALAWRYESWSKIVAIVVALLAAAAIFWMAFGLAFPASFGDFVPGVAFVLGFFLTLGGAIGAIVQGRRGNAAASATTGERRIIVGATAVLVVAMVASGALTLLTGNAAADASGQTATMADFAFAEGTYTVAADETATLVVHNSDGFVHDIAVPELGIDPVTVLPGSDAVVELPETPSGTYTIYCTLHSDTSTKDPQAAGMAATLVAQ